MNTDTKTQGVLVFIILLVQLGSHSISSEQFWLCMRGPVISLLEKLEAEERRYKCCISNSVQMRVYVYF